MGITFYVANLSPETTDADLEEHFGLYGEVVAAKVKLQSRKNGETITLKYPFAFVTMCCPSGPDEVLNAEHEIRGQVVEFRIRDNKPQSQWWGNGRPDRKRRRMY